jgi:hypothetical protein
MLNAKRCCQLSSAMLLVIIGWIPTEASVVDVTVTICELLANPERYSGKQVVVHAALINPRRMALADGRCGNVLLVFPSDESVKPRPTFHLLEDDSFKKLTNAESELLPMPPMKPGKIVANFEGRFDSVFILRKKRKVQQDPRSIRLAPDEVRLVLHQVTDVQATPASVD